MFSSWRNFPLQKNIFSENFENVRKFNFENVDNFQFIFIFIFYKIIFLHEKWKFSDEIFFKPHLRFFSFPTRPVSAPNSKVIITKNLVKKTYHIFPGSQAT